MTRDEAVQKLATVGHLSMAHAEDLYDSFFPKPVVPQCVADWYEEHKDGYDYELWDYFSDWDVQEEDDFKDWIREDENQPIITLVNMHQFGYEVEKEPRYRVRFKGISNTHTYLVVNQFRNFWSIEEDVFGSESTCHTRKELEEAGFGWVFDCPGVEVTEVE